MTLVELLGKLGPNDTVKMFADGKSRSAGTMVKRKWVRQITSDGYYVQDGYIMHNGMKFAEIRKAVKK